MKTTAMDEDKKIILEGVLQKFGMADRLYPIESLEKEIERYERTTVGGANSLIEHFKLIEMYERYYEKHINSELQLNTAVHYLSQVIKLRMIKINKDHCICTN